MSIEPTRRNLIRAAAWTAPVVVVAAASPAVAASGDANLRMQISPFVDGNNVSVYIGMTNEGPATTTDLTVTVSVALNDASRWGRNPLNLPEYGEAEAGWDYLGFSAVGGTRIFTLKATSQVPQYGRRGDFVHNFTPDKQNPYGSGVLTVVVTPGNGPATTHQQAFTSS